MPVPVIYQWNIWFETGDDRKTATDTRGASAWEPDVRLGSYDHIIFYRVRHSRVCIQYYFCCHEQIPCFIFFFMVYLKNFLASINQNNQAPPKKGVYPTDNTVITTFGLSACPCFLDGVAISFSE